MIANECSQSGRYEDWVDTYDIKSMLDDGKDTFGKGDEVMETVSILDFSLPNTTMYKRLSILHHFASGKGILHLEWRIGFSKDENHILKATF